MALHWQPPRRPRLGAGGDGTADLVLRNGRVYRGARADGSPQLAEAVAVRGGRVVEVGDMGTVHPLTGAATEVIDLEGRTVVPGLIDSHLHVVRAGLTWTDEVFWYEVASLEEAMGRLRAAAAQAPPGTWLRVVGGWHPGQFAEGRGPTCEELTREFPDRPVYVQLLYEEGLLNDAGLAAAGIRAGVGDPPRGSFERDMQGEPTGVVRGIGGFLHVLSQIPDPDDVVAGTRAAMEALAAWGVTGAIDAGGIGVPPESYEALFDLWRAGDLPIRMRLYVCPRTPGEEAEELTGWMRHARPGFGDGWLRHVGVGEVVVYGCHDLEGLHDFAVHETSKDALERILRDVARRGWPLHLHAVLDDTATAVLDVWERVDADTPIAHLRWSLAHVEPISDANLDRVAALGAGIAVQDRLVYRATDSARVWGEEAVRSGPPLRKILSRGIPLGAGTDATRVASPNPWVSLWWLVTGRTYDDGPWRTSEQCLTRSEALDAYTVGSAWFSLEEGERGRIENGFVADLAVLTDDYFSIADDDLARLGSDLTIVDGRVVHASGSFAARTG